MACKDSLEVVQFGPVLISCSVTKQIYLTNIFCIDRIHLTFLLRALETFLTRNLFVRTGESILYLQGGNHPLC